MRIWFLLLVELFRSVPASHAAEQTHGIPVQTTHKGMTVILPCHVDGGIPTQVHWFRMLKDSKRKRKIVDSLDMFVTTEYGNERTLKIKDVKETDQGRYFCESLILQKKWRILDLVVKVRPTIVSLTVSGEPPQQVGNTVRIQCEAKGNPTPTIHWKRISADLSRIEDIGVTGKTLTLHSVTKEAGGEYVCLATNGNDTDRRNITVDVIFDPEVDVYEETVIAEENEATTLMCRVTANPMAEHIFWTKGHSYERLSNSYRFQIMRDNELLKNYHTVITTLTIRAGNLHGDVYDGYWCWVGTRQNSWLDSKRVVIKSPGLL